MEGFLTVLYPLMHYQDTLPNSLFERMFSVMVPTWCQG